VLPSGFFQVQNQPPSITSLTPGFDSNGTRTVAIAGTNLSSDTKIYFDGLAGTFNNIDDAGRIVMTPPPAPSGYRANVVAVNSDGQDSTFLQGDNAPIYTYGSGDALSAAALGAPVSSLSANPASLPAGTDGLVEITGVNTNFVDGRTVVGFGSSDITVRRIWVTGPNRLLVNVSVSPLASTTSTVLSVTSGLQVVSQQFGFQAQTASNAVASLSSQMINAATGQLVITPGSTVIATLVSAPSPLGSSALSLSLNDRQLPILSLNGNQLTFQVPADSLPGQYALRVDANGQRGLPIGIALDAPPQQTSTAISNLDQ